MKPQTPIERESVTITLTPEEQLLLLCSLESFNYLDPSHYQLQSPDILNALEGLKALHNKLQFLFSNSDGACLRPAQPSEAVGQGGSICYQCDKRVAYLFDDSRCKDCTRLTFEEVQGNVDSVQSPDAVGQGGAQ